MRVRHLWTGQGRNGQVHGHHGQDGMPAGPFRQRFGENRRDQHRHQPGEHEDRRRHHRGQGEVPHGRRENGTRGDGDGESARRRPRHVLHLFRDQGRSRADRPGHQRPGATASWTEPVGE